jgi:hypothetical protein
VNDGEVGGALRKTFCYKTNPVFFFISI